MLDMMGHAGAGAGAGAWADGLLVLALVELGVRGLLRPAQVAEPCTKCWNQTFFAIRRVTSPFPSLRGALCKAR